MDTTLGREPAEGSEGEGSVLGAATDEVAAKRGIQIKIPAYLTSQPRCRNKVAFPPWSKKN